MSDNEWKLQERLAAHWFKHGLLVQQERLFLAAWEVMIPSWDLNFHLKKWNEPSIDFLFLDRQGDLWALELKRAVTSPREAWSVLCQVSHRAVQLKHTYAFEKLERAFTTARAGGHGRTVDCVPQGLQESHQAFFALPEPLPAADFASGGVRRVVAAKAFSPQWSALSRTFAGLDLPGVQAALQARYKISSTLEFKRVMAMTDWDDAFSGPVRMVLVEPSD